MKNKFVFVVYDYIGEEVRAVFSKRSFAEVYVEDALDSSDLTIYELEVDKDVL